MASKTPPKEPSPLAFTQGPQHALSWRGDAPASTPKALAERALASGDLAATAALCKEHSELLTQGASLGLSLLNAALFRRKGPISIALLARGAWAGLDPLAPGRSASRDPFEASLDNLWSALADAAPDCLFLDAASAALASSGRAFPSPDEWVRVALRRGKIELAVQVHDAHALDLDPSPSTGLLFDALVRGTGPIHGSGQTHPILNAMGGESAEERSGAWRLIALFRDALGQGSIQNIWTACILSNNAEHAARLELLNLLPQGWMLPELGQDMGPCSALVGAAIFAPDVFNRLGQLPDAVAAAASHLHSPRALAAAKGADLARLSRLGVDIGAPDANGQTFLHLWARSDREPRQGWAAVHKARPDLLDLPDKQGLTPRATQRERLAPKHLAAFDAMLAAIERSSLRRALPATAPHAPPRARKPRL